MLGAPPATGHTTMSLDALRVFVTVIELGSFAAAAAELGISRATATKRVDELEATAGVSLLLRTATGAVPTSAGRELAESAGYVLGQADRLLASVRGIGRGPSGLVRVVVPVGLPPRGWILACQGLQQRWPDLQFDLHVVSSPLDELRAGADLALVLTAEVPDGPWDATPIRPVPDHLLASEAYLERHGAITTPEDLRGHDLLAWRAPDGTVSSVPGSNGEALELTPRFVSNDMHLLYQMACSHLGIACVPHSGFPLPALGLAPLRSVLPVALNGAARTLHLVVPRGVRRVPRVRVMIDATRRLAERLAQMAQTPQVS